MEWLPGVDDLICVKHLEHYSVQNKHVVSVSYYFYPFNIVTPQNVGISYITGKGANVFVSGCSPSHTKFWRILPSINPLIDPLFISLFKFYFIFWTKCEDGKITSWNNNVFLISGILKMCSETVTLKYQLLPPKVYFHINSRFWYFLCVQLTLGDKERARREGFVKFSAVDGAESCHRSLVLQGR